MLHGLLVLTGLYTATLLHIITQLAYIFGRLVYER